MSAALKNSVVRPLLKKEGADIINMENYRPDSTLTFLSKIVEGGCKVSPV
jgi:hypothetical protein